MIVKQELPASYYENAEIITGKDGTIMKRIMFDEIEDASHIFRGVSFNQFPTYLQTGGSAWYNLGYNIFNNTHNHEIKVQTSSSTGTNYIFGMCSGETFFACYYSGGLYINGAKVCSMPVSTLYTIKIDNTTKKATVNDTEHSITGTKTSSTGMANIFATSAGATGYLGGGYYPCASGGRFYYWKIWDSEGNLVHHYVPYYDGHQAEVYDIVSKTVFAKQGTGSVSAVF